MPNYRIIAKETEWLDERVIATIKEAHLFVSEDGIATFNTKDSVTVAALQITENLMIVPEESLSTK